MRKNISEKERKEEINFSYTNIFTAEFFKRELPYIIIIVFCIGGLVYANNLIEERDTAIINHYTNYINRSCICQNVFTNSLEQQPATLYNLTIPLEEMQWK